MEVIYVTRASEQINTEPHVMAVGFFDGIHLGHQELLKRAKSLAVENNVLFTALTFSPHPDEVIKGDTDRKYLTPLPQKIRKMETLGVDKLFVMRFDKTFASLPPSDFIKDYIVGTNTRHVVVGFDFTFGFKAQGNTLLLRKEANNQKFGLSIIPKKTYLDEKISSTLIKELIGDGKVDKVPYCLGTNHQVSVKIQQQKNTEQFQIQMLGSYILPKPGIYHVEVSDGEKTVHGEFLRYSYSELDNEVAFSGLQDCLHKELSIVFLSSVTEASVITG